MLYPKLNIAELLNYVVFLSEKVIYPLSGTTNIIPRPAVSRGEKSHRLISFLLEG